MSKKKELSTILSDVIAIVSAIKAAADLISDASKKTLGVISTVGTLYNIQNEPTDVIDEKPEKAGTPKKKDEPGPGSEMSAEKTYTKADVRRTLAGIAATHRKEVKELLKKYGADTLSQLDERYYIPIMSEAEGLADS